MNFRWVFSLGGLEDSALDLDVDRHADVFPDLPSLTGVGYLRNASDSPAWMPLPRGGPVRGRGG